MSEQSHPGRVPRAPAAILVYATGVLLGLALVSFPALSDVLKAVNGFTDAEYGAIFLPQVALAAVSAIAGGALAQRLGLKTLLVLSILGLGLSQALLAGSALVATGASAYAMVLFGTAALGLGFGLSAAPLNTFPPILFPTQKTTAVVGIHSLIGVGLATGPLMAAPLSTAGVWFLFPVLLIGIAVVLGLAAGIVALPPDNSVATEGSKPVDLIRIPVFWAFVLIAMMYAFAEGTFANWAVIYLREARGLTPETAGLALSVFWMTMVAGRLLVTALLVRFPPAPFWLALPAAMAITFLLLPYAEGPVIGVGLFALAGLACSAFFPLTITLISERFPEHVAFVSSMMFAALMVGIGVGSFAIGALRELFSFETLYTVSAVYPLVAIVLAAAVLWRQRKAVRPVIRGG